jgi:orotate phosphoribosyltransferase
MLKNVSRKDIVLIIIFLIFEVGVAVQYLVCNNFNILGLTSNITLSVFGVVGLVQICLEKNWNIVVPDFFIKVKEQNQNKMIQDIIEAYFEKESFYIQEYNDQRMNYFLSQLGISLNYISKIKLDIIKMRSMPLKGIDDAKKSLEYIITRDYVIIDQDKYPPADLTYNEVKYYINFVDLMYDAYFSKQITKIMCMLIAENIAPFDKIVVPYDSNFLLAFEVGKRMGKPIVTMRKKAGRVLRDQCWDGSLNPTDRIIILHDVLVSGKQIINSIDKIPTCEVVGFYCLVARIDNSGMEALKERGIKINSILQLDDNNINELRVNNSGM